MDTKGTAVGKVLIDNQRVRVTEWRFPKKGDLEIETEGGEKTLSKLENGVPYFREAGVRHDVISANDFECAFIETELLESV